MVSRRNLYNFSSSKNTRQNDKISAKIFFIESIPFEDVNPDQIRQNNHKFRNIHNIENKLTRFHLHPETGFARKYKKPLYKTQCSQILVEYCRIRKRFRHDHRKINATPNGNLSLIY